MDARRPLGGGDDRSDTRTDAASRCSGCGAALPGDTEGGRFCPDCLRESAIETCDAGQAATAAALTPHPGAGHPERIGPYRIIRVLGQGGMGVVYLAEQEHPIRRQVALKVIKLGMDTREVVARFESERQALAVMNHENIARVFDAGATDRGRPFFVMEFVPGVPLTEYCDRNRLSNADRLRLFATICQAIQHAHQKGIIHRDLKPSNVLVTAESGRPVPKIIDFGIAKATDRLGAEQTAFTRDGSLVGTPEYMSPEQASMGAVEVDTRTDIYSLGVMLYELLVGVLPFESDRLRRAGFGEILRIVREVEPARPSTRVSTLGEAATGVAGHRQTDPSTLRRQLRGDLDWIILKSLEKDRARRYASASELAADIERHLADEPVAASPPGAAYRLNKAVRRHRVAVSGAAAVFLALLLGLIVATTLYVQTQRARLEADRQRGVAERQTGVAQTMYARSETAREDAERQRMLADRESYVANVAAAGLLIRSGRLDEARSRLAAAPASLRAWEWRYLYAQIDMSLARLGGDGGAVTSIAFTPDGQHLIWTSAFGVVRAASRRLYMPVQVAPRPVGAAEAVVAVTQDGTRCLTSPWIAPLPVPPALYVSVPGKPADQSPSQDETFAAQVFAAAGTTAGYPPGEKPFQAPPEVSEDLRTLHVGTRATGAVTATLVLPSIGVSAPVALKVTAPDVRTAGSRGLAQVRVTSAGVTDAAGRRLSTLSGRPWSVVSGVFSADGRRVVAWSWDNVPTLWDTDSGARLATLNGHTDGIVQMAFSPDGAQVVSASHDGTIRVWSVAGGEPVVARGHDGAVGAVAVSPDGSRIASGGADRTVRVWDRSGRLVSTLRGHEASVTAVAWSPDGRILASGSGDKTVRLWNVATTEEREVLAGHLAWIAALAFSPDGRELVSGSADGSVRVWDARRERAIAPDPRVTGDHVPGALDFIPAVERVIGASRDGVLRSWSIDEPGRVATLSDDTVDARRKAASAVTEVLVSRDGRRVISGAQDGSIRVWNLAGGGQPAVRKAEAAPAGEAQSWGAFWTQTGPSRLVTDVATTADGAWVAAALLDRTIRIWHLDSARATTIATGSDAVGGLTFSPDGTRVLAGVERVVRAWDARSGRLVSETALLPARVSSVVFSPDGQLLAAGCADGSVRLWRAESGAEVASLPGEGSGGALSVAFSETGSRLVVAYSGGVLTIWDTTSSHALLQLPARNVLRAAFTPDDTRIVALAVDGTVTIFDGRPAYDFEAETLVRRLFAAHDLSAAVVRQLRSDSHLAPPLREAAERLAQGQGDSAEWALTTAEGLARPPGRTPGDYQRALACADEAARLMPGHPLPLEARGLALYRLGRFQESIGVFRRAVELRDGYQLVDLVFLRMANLRLGKIADAQRLDSEVLAYRSRLQGVELLTSVEVSWLAEMREVEAQAAKKQ
jgi:WD40 repeat protein/serine/threonine protein kinase